MSNNKHELALEIFRHCDDVERYSAGLAEDASENYADTEASIYDLIYRIAGEKIADDYKSNRKLDEFRKKLSEIRYNASGKVLSLLEDDSNDLINTENVFLFTLMMMLFHRSSSDISTVDAKRIARYGKYHGLTKKQIMDKVTSGDVARIYETVSSGVSGGKSVREIVEDAQKQMHTTRRYVRGEVDAIVNGVVNDASLAFAAKNRLRLMYSSMMDDRTCEECVSLDGTVFDYDDPEIPNLPLHVACRCHLIPIADDPEENFSAKYLDVSFASYFNSLSEPEKAKRIGIIKYAGYRSGSLKINRFIEPPASARLSLSQIAKRDADFFQFS